LTDVTRDALVRLSRSWLDGVVDIEKFVSEYWKIRRCLLDARPELFTGEFGRLSSRVDTAVAVYSPAPRESYQIDEAELRRELEPTVRQLEMLDETG
jgi:hypothetical protein